MARAGGESSGRGRGDEAARDPGPEREALAGQSLRRPVSTPRTAPRDRRHATPEELTEIRVLEPGFVRATAVVPTRSANAEALERVRASARDTPRLEVGPTTGALDLKLEAPDGEHVKSGTVVLDAEGRGSAVPIDPLTRRFRRGGLPAGTYRLEAASASGGRASTTLEIRPGDVTRAAVALDGQTLRGNGAVRFTIDAEDGREIRARATDLGTGGVVVDRAVTVVGNEVEIAGVPFGIYHWNLYDPEANAESCYDSDVNDLFELVDPRRIELVPWRELIPEPDPPFAALPPEFVAFARSLSSVGVRSLEDLAAAEPEGLMHLMRDASRKGDAALGDRLLADAIFAARAALGVRAVEGEIDTRLRLAAGGTFERAFLPKTAGPVEILVDVGAGNRAELRVEGAGQPISRTITGSERIPLMATPESVQSRTAITVSVTNPTDASLSGVVHASLPLATRLPGVVLSFPSVWERIENIMQELALKNPGLEMTIPDAVKEPENISMWIDRAKSHMATAGVCSMNDLGRFRLDPMPILRTGVYVAPVVQPPDPGSVPVLTQYAFTGILGDSVLHYSPNETLHETAVILAGEWDIRGQTILVGKEVRELVVIVGSIGHDAGSRISWELPTLPQPAAYWPSPAGVGPHGSGPGDDGGPGQDGDQVPPESKNGGANAVTPAPIVTMYILDATNGLPPIDLRGQDGGIGGRGQDGGRGGDGQVGRRADGTLLGGCCRGVGHGGDGGRGGNGGRGGKGGRGGDGGRITVLTTPPGIAVMEATTPPIDVNRGDGGPGGPGGFGGPGGEGGPAGTADCEPWCDEHPERRGSDGPDGILGPFGFVGDPGPAVVSDAIQILPITEEQWLQEFNKPHILSLDVYDAEPGETVTITGQNFDPSIDRVFFDGADMGPVQTATKASFTVPLTSEGSYHPVRVRPAGPIGDRLSNRALLRVLPKLDAVPAGRWIEGDTVTLAGLAFVDGLQVLAEDRSTTPVTSYPLPVGAVTRTSIEIPMPSAPTAGLRGVRRIVVRNPDGGQSRDERTARLSDTIVVRCAAFRVLGMSPDTGTPRSVSEIEGLFAEGGLLALTDPWSQARIVFKLVEPVSTIHIDDDQANMWPDVPDDDVRRQQDRDLYDANGGVPGALNFFFFRETERGTAYAWIGQGLAMIGEAGPFEYLAGGGGFGSGEDPLLGPVDLLQLVAHELGHSLCLRHVCAKPEDDEEGVAATFFQRECEDGDEAFLMYPYWDTSDGMALLSGEVDAARVGATHVEDGKTSLSHPFDRNRCDAVDAQN